MRRLEPALLLFAAAFWQSAAAANLIDGTWINPSGSVAVQIREHGQSLSGQIVWADSGALADAKDSGVKRLIGTELLQQYRAQRRDSWAGRLFVPDKGRTFASTLRLLSADRLKVEGCLISGILCRSQTWHRKGPGQ
jgi:uncharacterized protein (DUF2147 family)